MTADDVEFVVGGWFHLAGRKLSEGHTIGTPLGRIMVKQAHGQRRKWLGHKRDLKIVLTKQFRKRLDRTVVRDD